MIGKSRGRRALLVAAASALAILATSGAGGGGCGGSGLLGVNLTVSDWNPCVGQTSQVTATPVNGNLAPLANVPCTFSSGAPGVATVDASGLVTALAPGPVDIQASCGGQTATATINVCPEEVTLDISCQGSGSVIAVPAGNGRLGFYDVGTIVQLTAVPIAPATFAGWSGNPACAGVGPCSLPMTGTEEITARFAAGVGPPPGKDGGPADAGPGDGGAHDGGTVMGGDDDGGTFVGPFSAALGNVTLASTGCSYDVSISGTLTFALAEANGQVSGTSASAPSIQINSSYSPPSTSCTESPFSVSATGTLSGDDADLETTLTDPTANPDFQMSFSGARNGGSITGSLSVNDTLHDNEGNAYPVSGSDSMTLMEQ